MSAICTCPGDCIIHRPREEEKRCQKPDFTKEESEELQEILDEYFRNKERKTNDRKQQ